MKHAFRLSRVRAALVALAAAAVLTAAARAQTLSPSPDTAIFQITSTAPSPTPAATATPTPSPTPTPTPTTVPIIRNSYAGDISGNGRFVVIESNADIATNRSAARNNADGNQEIFLFDYAQRRVYQITDTKSALKDTTKAADEATNIDVAVVNLMPVISHDGKFIVFISNAYSDANPSLTPKQFVGQDNAAALKADGNTEIFIYALPSYPEVSDLSQGTEIPEVDLSTGTMTRVTTTPASTLPRAATAILPAFFARDNDNPVVNDDGSLVAFVSKARSGNVGAGNPDGNKEIFVVKNPASSSRAFTQVTATADIIPAGSVIPTTFVFNEAPTLSACDGVLPCRLAYVSNADLGTDEATANRGNGELIVATLNSATGAVQSTRQLTKTPPETRAQIAGASVNILSPGRRLTRDGSRLVFESSAPFNADGTLSGALANSFGIYIVNVSGASPTFEQVGQRPPSNQLDLSTRWPTFTGDSTRVVWASNLNYLADGTIATATGTGLNQSNLAQVFSAPVAALTTVSRVTNLGNPGSLTLHGSFNPLQPFPADNIRRMALSLGSEQGGGNADASSEAFYQLIPVATSETPAPSPTPATSPAPVSFSTGASDEAVVAPSPSPTPPDVTGLAPGMLGIARSTLALAPASVEVNKTAAHDTLRRPPLPLELSGVSVTVSGAAAGLYFVSPGRINFVVPKGLVSATTAAPVVIFNNGSLIRTSLLLNFAQPDIFTTTNGPGGRAAALNVTNMCVMGTAEPFTITSPRPTNNDCTSATTETVATTLQFFVTGMRGVLAPATVTVRIGTTDIVGTADPTTSPIAISPTNTPGIDQVTVTLPASLEHAGDVPVIITVAATAGTASSRPADTAPHITIQ
ncbi:MAG: PD40 domain-containing protein [Acidobacteria bacterium]|nr:PD40 domain-containing protein [Acidobacteriota bacterium]